MSLIDFNLHHRENTLSISEQSDSELITLCLTGQEAAWDVLLTRYERLIYYVALGAGANNTDEAADVFQAVCLIWLEELERLRDSSRLGPWLVTITRRECRARWRRDHSAGGDPEILLENQAMADEPPEALAAQSEDAHTMQLGLKQLAEPCRTLLWLLYFDPNHPAYTIIAHNLNIPANSIGPTRARCLDKLKEIMRQAGW